MKRNISDLMDYIQDAELSASCQTPLSPQRIKELTMSKIKKNKKSRLTFRVLLVAAILAGLGVTAVAADQIWGFSGEIFGKGANIEFVQPEHVETIDRLGASFPGGITSNGATITPISVLGDDRNFYLHLRVEAPEDVVLPDGVVYQLFGMNGGQAMQLYVPENAYKDISCTADLDVLEDEDPTDNVKDFVLKWTAIDEHVDMKFNDGISKILTISGLWEQVENGIYREIFTGDFSFDIGRYQMVEIAKAKVEGLSASINNEYSVTLQTMTVNPLGIHYIYTATLSNNPTEYPRGEFVIVLKDGTKVETVKGLVGRNEDGVSYSSWANFYESIDLEQIDYILFGEHKIAIQVEKTQTAPLPEKG